MEFEMDETCTAVIASYELPTNVQTDEPPHTKVLEVTMRGDTNTKERGRASAQAVLRARYEGRGDEPQPKRKWKVKDQWNDRCRSTTTNSKEKREGRK